jgi:hypothetical protein
MANSNRIATAWDRIWRGRRVRFSLRALAIVVTALTIWIGLKTHRAIRQKYAVETISSLGGQIWYAHQIVSRGAVGGINELDPEKSAGWLSEWLGEHFFVTPLDLHLGDRRFIESKKLALIADLPDLEKLSFGRMRFASADLAELPPLGRLRELAIESSFRPSENGLSDFSFLTGYPRLQVLRLPFGSFSDEDVEYLRGALDLRCLIAANTQLGDAGLGAMGRMTELEVLDASNTRVSDEGLACLARFPKLRSLRLNGTSVSDDGLAALRDLKNLESLQLIDVAVSDAGLEHLRGLRKLTRLELIHTRATDEGVKRLHQALPKCRIRIDWGQWVE